MGLFFKEGGGGSSSASSAGGGDNTYSNLQDFLATPNAGTETITVTGLPFTLEAKHIISGYAKLISADGSINNLPLTNVSVTGGVITLEDMTSNFESTDTVLLTITGPDKAYFQDLDSRSVTIINPLYNRYTAPQSMLSAAYTLTNTFVDVGSEISVGGYKYITLWITLDINSSVNAQIRILHKHRISGSEEYREIYLGNPASNLTTINLNDYEVEDDSDQLFKITLPITGTRSIQIQAKDEAGADGQITALYVTKDY